MWLSANAGWGGNECNGAHFWSLCWVSLGGGGVHQCYSESVWLDRARCTMTLHRCLHSCVFPFTSSFQEALEGHLLVIGQIISCCRLLLFLSLRQVCLQLQYLWGSPLWPSPLHHLVRGSISTPPASLDAQWCLTNCLSCVAAWSHALVQLLKWLLLNCVKYNYACGLSYSLCRFSHIWYCVDCPGAALLDCHGNCFHGNLLLVLSEEPASCH